MGDSLRVSVGNRADVPLALAGRVHDLSQAPAWQEGMVYGFLDRATMARLAGDAGLTVLRVVVAERGGDVAHVRVGSNVLVRAIAFPGREFRGRVIEVGHRMGRKNVRTDDPIDRNDTKILEVVVVLESSNGLVVGQRVMSYVRRGG